MTRTEEAVYGATFAARFAESIKNTPHVLYRAGKRDEWEQYERQAAVSAAEAAAYAVERLREIAAGVAEGWDGSIVAALHAEAIGGGS